MLIDNISFALHQAYSQFEQRLIDFAESNGNGKMSLVSGSLELDPSGVFTGAGYCLLTSASLEYALSKSCSSTLADVHGVHLKGGDMQPSSYKRLHTILKITPTDSDDASCIDLVYKQKNFLINSSMIIIPESELPNYYPGCEITKELKQGELPAIIIKFVEEKIEYQLLYNTLYLLLIEALATIPR